LARLQKEAVELAHQKDSLIARLKACGNIEDRCAKTLIIPVDPFTQETAQAERDEKRCQELKARFQAFPIEATKKEIAKAVADVEGLESENKARKMKLRRVSGFDQIGRSDSMALTTRSQTIYRASSAATLDPPRETEKMATSLMNEILVRISGTESELDEMQRATDQLREQNRQARPTTEEDWAKKMDEVTKLTEQVQELLTIILDTSSMQNKVNMASETERKLAAELDILYHKQELVADAEARQTRALDDLTRMEASIEEKRRQNEASRADLAKRRQVQLENEQKLQQETEERDALEKTVLESEEEVHQLEARGSGGSDKP
jgi:hypothetical protein